MSDTEELAVVLTEETPTDSTSVTLQQPRQNAEVASDPTPPPSAEDLPMDAQLTPYHAYLEIHSQLEQFQKLAEDDQAVAITLPDYPFFTETRLQSIMIHQSGTISIQGEAKGGKVVSVRDQVDSLSYALSVMSKPVNSVLNNKIEVGFVTSN